jgi:hypothetical protein
VLFQLFLQNPASPESPSFLVPNPSCPFPSEHHKLITTQVYLNR